MQLRPSHNVLRHTLKRWASTQCLRHFATATTDEPILNIHKRPSTAGLHVFDQETKRWQRNVAARKAKESREVDYLRDEVADRLVDRILVLLFLFSAARNVAIDTV